MSRWLKNVGQFLEKLDDQAAEVVEQQRFGQLDDIDADRIDDQQEQQLASILSSRGLDQEEDGSEEEDIALLEDAQQQQMTPEPGDDLLDPSDYFDDDPFQEESSLAHPDAPVEKDTPEAMDKPDSDVAQPVTAHPTAEPEASVAADELEKPSAIQEETKMQHEDYAPVEEERIETPVEREAQPDPAPEAVVDPPAPVQQPKAPPALSISSQQLAQLREAQKEARMLRKHVLSLNTQLETAEAEVQAQRDELERAAQRIEADRQKFKQDLAEAQVKHTNTLQSLKEQHDVDQQASQARADTILKETKLQLQDLQTRHQQEGGDWTKELQDAVAREQETLMKLAAFEDEKGVLLSQISTLQTQQDVLGTRLESLTETADHALAAEREAEKRLDEALSLHAKQLQQRNTREAELEQRVAELSSALVSQQQKQPQQQPGAVTAQEDVRHALEQETISLRQQVEQERQQNITLQKELRELTRERTHEVKLATSGQLEADRKLASLTHELSEVKRRLAEESELKQVQPTAPERSSSTADWEDVRQIKSLSEEVLKQREAVIHGKTEIAALKSRLRAAIGRAEQAEAAVQSFNEIGGEDTLERGVRRRPRKSGKKQGTSSFPVSMKSVLHLDAAQSSTSSGTLGMSLDVMDDALAKGGSMLRYNPVARLMFLAYLLILHLWTFFLLHVHTSGGLENFHSVSTHHGPHSLLETPDKLILPQDPSPVVAPVPTAVASVAHKTLKQK